MSKANLNTHKVTEFQSEIECLIIQTNFDTKTIRNFCDIYRAHSQKIPCVLHEFEKLQEFLRRLKIDTIMCGDFIIDTIKESKDRPEYEKLPLAFELELNVLEESDDLPIATMTSSSSKPKTLLSTGQMSDITCNYCKEKGHMVKDCEKLKKKKEKDAQQGRLRRNSFLKVELVARRTIRKNDVGKAQVHTLNPSAPHPSIQTITNQIPKLKDLRESQHRPIVNPHLPTMSQKTSFATIPI